MQRWRKFGVLALLTIGTALAGCLGGKAQAPRTEIRFCFFGGYEAWQMFRAIVREFEALEPTLRVKLIYWPGNYEDRLKLVMAAGTAPDVVTVQDEPFAAYCARNQFLDLTPFIRRHPREYAPDRFFPTALEVFRYRGRQYTLPWNGGMVLVYYNKTLFDAAGLPYPARDWTWSDFLTACRRLTRDLDGDGRIDQYGFELPTHWMNALPFIWSAGGDTLSDDMTRPTWSDPRTLAGLRFMYDLRFEHRVVPLAAEFTGLDQNTLFMTRRVAMVHNGPWGLPFMRQTGLDWDIAHMPIGPAGRWTRATWDGVSIFRRSRHPEAAWKFIHFLCGERGQWHVAHSGRALPARRSQAAAFVRADTPQREEVFLEAMEMGYARLQKMPERWAQIDSECRPEMERLLLGRQTPEEMASSLQRKVTRILEGAL